MIEDIVLYSYRRPEMTDLAIQRIQNWNANVRIHVSIDGLRHNAFDEEVAWRSETIRRTEKLAESSRNIFPYVWEVNDGLTAHALRIFDKVFEKSWAVCSLEEDNLVSNDGFDFLTNSTASMISPGIASAYTSQGHLTESEHSRFTLFPEQWATALNLPIYEKFKEVWFSKKIDKKVTAQMVGQHFESDWFYRNIVIEKWHRIFLASVNDRSYGDALMTYAAFSLGTPYQVPLNSYVRDLGNQDNRGLHPRNGEVDVQTHNYKKYQLNEYNFCEVCERSSTGISGTGLSQLVKYAGRRLHASFGLSEMQLQK